MAAKLGVSARAAGRLIRQGVSDTAVHKAAESGRITRLDDGTFDPATVAQEWEKNTDPARVTSGKAGVTTPPTEAAQNIQGMRLVREAFETKLVELEYRKKIGELVPLEEMESAIFEVARRVRDRLLGMAPRLAPVVAGLGGNTDDCFKAIEEEVHLVLDELAGMKP